jgi:hypothetical protein
MKKILVLALGFAFVSSACFSTTSYHTAETLDKGVGEVGFGWGATQLESVSATEANGEVVEADLSGVPSLPNIIPDILIRYGVADDVEVGVKLFTVGVAADVKWRFVHTDNLSLAIAPTFQHARPFLVLEENTGALPLMASVRLNKTFSVYGAAKVFISQWSLPVSGDAGDEADEVLSDLQTGGFGGTLGVTIDFKRVWVRPEFNIVQYTLGLSDSAEEVAFNYSSAGVAFGFNFGKEDKKIQKLEERMDKLEGK